jgi:PAS domain S-box-containing protein
VSSATQTLEPKQRVAAAAAASHPPAGRGAPSKRRWLLAACHYGLAALLVAAAIAITLAMQEWDVHVFLFSFYAAVVAAAWIGTGPGCFAVALSVVAVQYFFTPPEWSFEVNPEDVPFTGTFVICAIMTLAWSWQRKRTERALQQARDTLEVTVQERTAELVETNAALKNEIGERRAAEEELRRSETLLAQGQKLSRTASWTLEPATGEMRWSAELFDILGTDRAAAFPSYPMFRDRVHPDDRARFDAAMAMAIEGSSNFSCEVRIVVDDGGVKHVQALGEIRADPSRGKEVIGTVMDLTERKRTEQALHDAEAELARTLRLATVAELTASIAHEINQPLAAIVANASACVRFLARRPAALANARETADCIVSDGTRAGEVIRRIRALLRKDAAPHHVAVDLNRVIDDVIDLLRATLDRQRIAVHTDLADALPPVMGDPVQLQQVLVNLITNAAEAMGGIGNRPRIVTIRSGTEDAAAIVVTVEDNGIGLDPAETDRIFDSFYTTKAEGIGVGLSISRSIIEAHGGQLSAAPGRPDGARFSFTVPVAEASAAEAAVQAAMSVEFATKSRNSVAAKPKSPRR